MSYTAPDNGDRAEWALVGVNAYAAETRNDPREQTVDVDNPDDQEAKDHAEEVISDLMCDIRHLCDVLGVSFEGIDRRAANDYRQDVAEAQQ